MAPSKGYLKHGHCKSKAYAIWRNMKGRCNNPNFTSYKNYGGKGVSCCEKWEDFLGFLEDMGDCPDGFQLDRIDSSGNYQKENCQWLSRYSNSVKRRPSVSKKDGLPRGVYTKNGVSFSAIIKVLGKSYALGTFANETDASEAYRKMHLEWHGFYAPETIKNRKVL